MALTKATYSMISGAVINVFDYMTPAQIAAVQNNTVLDVSGPIQAALDAATLSGSTGRGWAVFMPMGRYYIGSTLSIPNGTMLFGAGRQQTGIRPMSGFTGVMITDKGNASKIVLRDFRVDGLKEAGLTDVIKMGYGAEPLGGAEWFNLFIYTGNVGDPHLTANGINVVTNVMDFTELEVGFSATDFRLGPNSGVTTFERCFSIGAYLNAFYTIGNTNIVNCEIEAPGANCVPIYVNNEVNVQNLTFSQSNSGVTNNYIILTSASARLVTVDGLVHADGGGASTLTTVINDFRTGYPSAWGDPGGNERMVSSINNNVFTKDFYILNLKRQAFKFQLYTNSGGTIYHKITSAFSTSVESSFSSKINGATTTGTVTPTGTDSSTAFAAGAKISSVATNTIILDTADQTYLAWASGLSVIGKNDFGTPLNVEVSTLSSDVNGTTRNRIVLEFYNASTGAAYNLTSIAGSNNKTLNINCEIYIA